MIEEGITVVEGWANISYFTYFQKAKERKLENTALYLVNICLRFFFWGGVGVMFEFTFCYRN